MSTTNTDQNRKSLLRTGCLIIIGAICFLVIGLNTYKALRPPREDYGLIDFENDRWIQRFVTQYEEAKTNDDDWINDPEEIALRIAGYPNPDNIPPQSVEEEVVDVNHVVFTILSRPLFGDSIKQQEYRIELELINDDWEIEWAGMRQTCRRGTFGGWTKSPCP